MNANTLSRPGPCRGAGHVMYQICNSLPEMTVETVTDQLVTTMRLPQPPEMHGRALYENDE